MAFGRGRTLSTTDGRRVSRNELTSLAVQRKSRLTIKELTTTALQSLRDVRERLLGYSFDGAARLSGIAADRLRALEEDRATLTVFESEILGKLYGLDADQLVERPIQTESGDGVTTFASIAEFREVSDSLRATIVSAANAARDLRTLSARLTEPEPRKAFQALKKKLRLVASDQHAAHRQGALLAAALRRALKLKTAPIPSVRDLVAEQFPMVAVLYANLPDEALAGLTFADAVRGPAIVLNLGGKNRNPLVRRFSLLHELCHLLWDWVTGEPLATLSGFLNEKGLDRERRANAFAVRLLCPEKVIKEIGAHEDPSEVARSLMRRFGLPYAAVRLYLKNESRLAELPPAPLPKLLPIDPTWESAEEPGGIKDFPLAGAPAERRTRIAERASTLYARGEIQRDELARLLGVTPTEDLENVLSFFGLDPPSTSAVA